MKLKRRKLVSEFHILWNLLGMRCSNLLVKPIFISKQCNDLERVQKRACRIILGNDYVRYSDALQLCSIVTLVCRRNHLCQSFAKTLPSSVLKHLLPQRYDSGYQLRNSGLLGQFKCRTERYRKSPLPHLTRLFNNWFAVECSFLCALWLWQQYFLSRFFFPATFRTIYFILCKYLSLLNQLFLK